jgi:hypothetical protein
MSAKSFVSEPCCEGRFTEVEKSATREKEVRECRHDDVRWTREMVVNAKAARRGSNMERKGMTS